MNIKLLDAGYNVLGELDNFYSLIWHRRYFDVGTFQLTAGPDETLFSAKYIYRPGAAETGRIERMEVVQDDLGNMEVTVSGRFLESFLADRIIYPTYATYSTKQAGQVICDLINANIVSPADASRRVENVRLGEVAETPAVDALQVTHDNLAEYVYGLCLQCGCSVRAVYDFNTNQVVFSVWTGKDRTQDQNLNDWVMFSDTFDNILSADYYKDDENLKNFVYVAGEGEGASRIVETLNAVKTGEDRREMFVDARDLRTETDDGATVPLAGYRNMLKQRGREKQSEHIVIENLNCEVDVNNRSFVYRQDYDLGDICTVQHARLGLRLEKRITECIETWEQNAVTVSVVFGEDILNFWKVGTHK